MLALTMAILFIGLGPTSCYRSRFRSRLPSINTPKGRFVTNFASKDSSNPIISDAIYAIIDSVGKKVNEGDAGTGRPSSVGSVSAPEPTIPSVSDDLEPSNSSKLSTTISFLIRASAVGLLTGAAIVLFKSSIAIVATWLYDDLASVLPKPTFYWPLALFPILGSTMVSLLTYIQGSNDFLTGANIDNIARSVESGSINPVAQFMRQTAAVFTMASGVSLGPEGSCVEIGTGISRLVTESNTTMSWLGLSQNLPSMPLHVNTTDSTTTSTGLSVLLSSLQSQLFIPCTPLEKQQLFLAGTSAAVAAGFNAPFTGILFALECGNRYLSNSAVMSSTGISSSTSRSTSRSSMNDNQNQGSDVVLDSQKRVAVAVAADGSNKFRRESDSPASVATAATAVTTLPAALVTEEQEVHTEKEKEKEQEVHKEKEEDKEEEEPDRGPRADVAAIALSATLADIVVSFGLQHTESFSLKGNYYAMLSPVFELPLYLGLGLICGLISVLFSNVKDFYVDLFQADAVAYEKQEEREESVPSDGVGESEGIQAAAIRSATPALSSLFASASASLSSLPAYLKPLVGGLVCGIVAVFYPQTLFAGYATLDGFISGRINVDFVLLIQLLVIKIQLTALSLASGLVGGVFAPSLFFGATAGSAYHSVVSAGLSQLHQLVDPHLSGEWFQYSNRFLTLANAPAYATVGAAATLGAVFRAPLTSSMLMFELTENHDIVLPVLASTGLGGLFAEILMQNQQKQGDVKDKSR